MPTAALRPCAGHCGAYVPKGRCAACSRQTEQQRGSSHQRGYTKAWHAFRKRFVDMLVDQGILPVCGATLPGGPVTTDSTCKAAKHWNAEYLHLDHEPPLRDDERHDVSKVCDPLRVQLLCARDHGVKTRREQLQGVGGVFGR